MDEQTGDAPQISLGPNPCKEQLNIYASQNVRKGKVFVYDLQGKLMLQKVLEAKTTIGMSDLKAAVYLVEVYDAQGNKVLAQQIVKE